MSERPDRPGYGSVALAVALSALVVIGTWVTVDVRHVRQLFTFAVSEGDLVLIAVVFALYGVRILTGVPSAVISFFVGVKFGMVPGIAIVLVGSVITAIPGYLIGRKSRELPDWIPGVEKLRQLSQDVIEQTGVYRGMIAASFSPTPLDPVAYGAGLAGVPFPVFLGATVLAAVPWAGAYCYTGAVTGSLGAEAGPPSLAVVTIGLLIAVLVLARPIKTKYLEDE